MKKNLTTLLLLLCLGAFSRLDAGCRKDSMYSYTFGMNGLKEHTGTTYYSYDANGFLTEERNIYLDAGQWLNNYKFTYTNNSKGKYSDRLFQMWDPVANNWLNNEKAFFSYDSKDLLIESVLQGWDSSNLSWVNGHKILETYNSAGQETLYVVMSWSNNQWKNVGKNESTYDSSGLQTSLLSYNWDGSNWYVANKVTFTYNAGKETERLVERWQAGNWVKIIRELQTFNSGKLTGILRQGWDNIQWVSNSQELYNFDDINCTFKTDFYYNWNKNDSQWDYHMQDSSFSKKTTGIHPVNKTTVKVYPNPTQGELNIYAEYATGITLMDISGRTAYESQLTEGENTLDIKDLQPGVYFLKTKDGTYKILKE